MNEYYDAANGGRITQSQDLNGNTVTYNYTGSQLTSIYTTDTGGPQESTNFAYTGSGYISSISTSYFDSSGLPQTLTQEYYGYDTSGRLSTITTDLSPTDNSTSDGNTFVTTYGYLGTTDQISSITSSDGSSLTIGYFTGTAQVQTITQTVASGVTRVTTFSNTYGSGQETVTDPLQESPTSSPTAPPARSACSPRSTRTLPTAPGPTSTRSPPSAAGPG